MLLPSLPALLLVDIQQGFDEVDYWGGRRNNPDAEENAGHLLEAWRKTGLPLYHVKHNSIHPASPLVREKPGNAFHEAVQPLPEEKVIEKRVNSAFIGTNFEALLRAAGINTLLIAGMTTDHCISTTVRMAGNLEFKTFLVADACATFDKKGLKGEHFSADLIHETALASLQGEFAEVIDMEKAMALIASL